MGQALLLSRRMTEGEIDSGVNLDSQTLRVRLGWAFSTLIPRRSIRHARRVSDAEGRPRFGSIGAHRVGDGSFCVNAAWRNCLHRARN
jgi:hypothetical protein